jgi:hypothetical protein
MTAVVASLLLAFAIGAAQAGPQRCVPAEIVLWGDGRHDDTFALNAWFRGAPAVWADSGAPVGAAIAGRSFRLSDAVYVPGGSGRSLSDFRMVWPERGETVTGGTIAAGSDAAAAPLLTGITIIGGDDSEGKPFEMTEPDPARRDEAASCATS